MGAPLESAIQEHETFWQSAYQKHGNALLAYLRVRVPDASEAEDLLHETFVKAIRGMRQPEEITQIRSYLFTIAHHLLLNHIRDRRRPIHLVADSSDAADQPELVDSVSPSPVEAMQHRSFAIKLNQILNQMNPRLRTAFDLGILNKLAYADIAKTTGWTLSTVKINVHRARKFAMQHLSEFLP